jgi:tRNA G26 N,N-dimethylase Trm1
MATKKKVTKKVSKKATAIAKVKVFKHKRVTLEPIGTETFPDMVFVAAGPSWASSIVGKRYVNESRAISIIEALDAEKNIAKGAKAVTKELLAAGVTPLDTSDIETEEK